MVVTKLMILSLYAKVPANGPVVHKASSGPSIYPKQAGAYLGTPMMARHIASQKWRAICEVWQNHRGPQKAWLFGVESRFCQTEVAAGAGCPRATISVYDHLTLCRRQSNLAQAEEAEASEMGFLGADFIVLSRTACLAFFISRILPSSNPLSWS
jgi:hypothetical protein